MPGKSVWNQITLNLPKSGTGNALHSTVFIFNFSMPFMRRSEWLFIEAIICIFVWSLNLIKNVHKEILLHQRCAKRHKNQCFAAACLVKITTMTYDRYDVFVIGKKNFVLCKSANSEFVQHRTWIVQTHLHVPSISLKTHIELSKMHGSYTQTCCVNW